MRAAGHGPGDRLEVAFPRLDGAERLDGLVLEGPWRDPEAEDVAFVRLDGVPAGAEAVALGPAGGQSRSPGAFLRLPRSGPAGGTLRLRCGR
ncbi:hypothetical protein [Streptomyces sp. NPDC047981]|uniref:hypothetical protein n=1 Tax=Streptomyces sp. NPDC047981 TaxID=3154610 RepID=UPI00341DDB96